MVVGRSISLSLTIVLSVITLSTLLLLKPKKIIASTKIEINSERGKNHLKVSLDTPRNLSSLLQQH